MRRLAKWIGIKLCDFVEAIYQNRPEGERMTQKDIEMRQEARNKKKEFLK